MSTDRQKIEEQIAEGGILLNLRSIKGLQAQQENRRMTEFPEWTKIYHNIDFKKAFNCFVEFHCGIFKFPKSSMPPLVLVMFKNGTITKSIGIETYHDYIIMDGIPIRFPPGIAGIRGIQFMINEYGAQEYLLAVQAWTDGKIYRPEDRLPESDSIAALPANHRTEVLYFIGNTRNRKYALGRVFEVKREIHGDDNSKCFDLIEIKDYKISKPSDLTKERPIFQIKRLHLPEDIRQNKKDTSDEEYWIT